MILGFWAFFLVLELLIPLKSFRFFKKGFWLELLLYTILQSVLLPVLVFKLIEYLYAPFQQHLITGLPTYLQVIILILSVEFIAYWVHRLNHAWWPMWRLHEVHHTSEELTCLSAARIHFLEIIFIRIVGAGLLAILGATETTLYVFTIFDAFMALFIHSNIKVNVGPLKYIFNSPQMHHIHHSNQLKYQQSNYGDKITIYDWLFGTALTLPATDLEKLEYGIGYDYPQKPLGQFTYMFRKKGKEDLLSTPKPNNNSNQLV
jgi:sterol desaturase/sphingolipid hydroxylase (fatty acid hydroxylase superfamily)